MCILKYIYIYILIYVIIHFIVFIKSILRICDTGISLNRCSVCILCSYWLFCYILLFGKLTATSDLMISMLWKQCIMMQHLNCKWNRRQSPIRSMFLFDLMLTYNTNKPPLNEGSPRQGLFWQAIGSICMRCQLQQLISQQLNPHFNPFSLEIYKILRLLNWTISLLDPWLKSYPKQSRATVGSLEVLRHLNKVQVPGSWLGTPKYLGLKGPDFRSIVVHSLSIAATD